MVQLHVVCVSTHSKGYFPILIESCKKNNIKLHVLGFNKKWQGFVWRFHLIQSFLGTLPKTDIVMFIDAYDVIILQDYSVILDRFLKMKTNILLSRDGDATGLHKYFYQKVFSKCGDYYINAGSYMGYVGALQELFTLLCSMNNCNNFNLDDQRMLSRIHEDQEFFNKNIKIDIHRVIFYNVLVKHIFTTDINVCVANGKIINNKGIEPCVIHAPGNGNLNGVAKLNGYKLVKVQKESFINGAIRMIPIYIHFFYPEIICFIILIILIIVQYFKHKKTIY
jgi:hypothetical protein